MSGDSLFLIMSTSLLFGTGGMIAAFLGFRRAARAMDEHGHDLTAVAPVLAEMKLQLDELVLEVERLGESQRFTAQLQIERAETLRALQQPSQRVLDSR